LSKVPGIQRLASSTTPNALRIFFRLIMAVPLPLKVIVFLMCGFVLGACLPSNPIVRVVYNGATYFPRLIVTFAALLIFHLLSAAVAKLILYHKQQAGRLFLHLVSLYVLMGIVSLIYATLWIGELANLPLIRTGSLSADIFGCFRQIQKTFTHVLSEQPMLQVLVGGIAAGWISAKTPAIRGVAEGLIRTSDLILAIFRKLLWFYPLMIGGLAIGIPMKFGYRGLALYGQCVLWDAIVILVWCVFMVLFCKVATRRNWRQIASYYGTVWPTGFGTGGSYDTLAVNLVSAEKDLGLDPEIAEVSIVFGTVLNKNCATMSVLLVTVIVARLLSIPLSLLEIVLLVPPVVVLGLETPGIPGGAGYFMSPVLAVLLKVPDPSLWVTTFIAVYSGLIPMFSTAGNTTDDGVVGALIQDRLQPARKHAVTKRAVTLAAHPEVS